MKLNNCPICGHTPIIDRESLDRGNGHGYPGHYEYKISCSNKGNCPLSRDIPMFSYTDIVFPMRLLQVCMTFGIKNLKKLMS